MAATKWIALQTHSLREKIRHGPKYLDNDLGHFKGVLKFFDIPVHPVCDCFG